MKAYRCWVVALAGGLLTTLPAVAVESAQVQARWQAYELNFSYMGFTTYYSCDGLRQRMEELLKQLGARADVSVSVLGCAGEDISRMLMTRIKVALPVAGDASGESFNAAPATVTLKSMRPGDIGSGECELLEQVRDRVLPALQLKAQGDNLVCVPGHASAGQRTLRVQALVAVPEAKR
ncbi:MAG: hypothetical protein QM808_14855 [Steroidobacteraceae bacterium]